MTLEEKFDALNRIDRLSNVAKRALRRAMADEETLQRMGFTREELVKEAKEVIDTMIAEAEHLKDDTR